MDDSGEGQPMSSGSGADPTAYMGAHFAVEPQIASQFATPARGRWQSTRYEGEKEMPRVLKVYLRITNPKDFGDEHNLRQFINQGKVSGDALDIAMESDGIRQYESEEAEAAAQEWYNKYENDVAFRTEQNRYLFEEAGGGEGTDDLLLEAAQELASQARGRLETAGHDGIHYKNVVEGGTAWIAFAPNQIKSAWAQEFNAQKPQFTAAWTKKAAGFAFKSFKKLWHVGSMNPNDKRDDSYEGAGLSVSVNPEEWQEIARIGGDLWELTKAGNKFVNYHRLSKAQKQQIANWGVQNGYATPAELWRHSYYDDELEEWRYSDFDTKQKAEAE